MKLSPSRITPLAVALALALGACSAENKRERSAPSGPLAPPLLAKASDIRPDVRDVSVLEASAMIDAEAPVTVLDLRTPTEFVEGHIKGAINLDALSEDFVDQLGALRKDRTYLIHCRSGRRSAAALEVMKEARFTKLAHMNEGMIGWNEAGLPLVP